MSLPPPAWARSDRPPLVEGLRKTRAALQAYLEAMGGFMERFSQLVDTAIVNSILFYWGFGLDLWTGVSIMVTIYLHKLVLAALDTPVIYLGVYLLKAYIGHDELAARGVVAEHEEGVG